VADNTGVHQQIMLVVIDAVGEGARDIVDPKPKAEMTAQQFVEPAAGMGDECSRSVTCSRNAALVISARYIDSMHALCSCCASSFASQSGKSINSPFCQIGDEQSDPIVHEKIPQIWHF
jgi:hypothetical protein